jgi:hypothetical protein
MNLWNGLRINRAINPLRNLSRLYLVNLLYFLSNNFTISKPFEILNPQNIINFTPGLFIEPLLRFDFDAAVVSNDFNIVCPNG